MNTQITKIKIFGERNSGTNYIEKLLTKNIKSQVYIESGDYKSKLGWKHGLPNQQKIDVNNTLVVCIIRDLDTWMNSMYYSPYHLIKKKNFSDFITQENFSSDNRSDHPVNIYNFERKNLFHIRYKKFQRYLTFLKTHQIILVHLRFAQQQPEKLLSLLNHFNIKIHKTFTPILKHTKTCEFEQNNEHRQKYKITSNIYNKYANHKLETYINNLSYKINKNK